MFECQAQTDATTTQTPPRELQHSNHGINVPRGRAAADTDPILSGAG